MDAFQSDPPPAAVVPAATRAIAALTAGLTLATLAPGGGPRILAALALVPQATVGRFFLWNVATAGLVEVYRPAVLVTVPAFVLLGRWVEAVWGASEFALFSAVVSTAAACAAFFALLAAYMITRSQIYIFTPVGGLSAVIFGLLVAVKQLIPDHTLGSGPVALRVNYVPLIVATAAFSAYLGNLLHLGGLIFSIGGLYFSWLYLRFFQRRETDRGDMNDAFAFHTFFPDPLAPVVALVSALVFAAFAPLIRAITAPMAQQKPATPAAPGPSALENYPPSQRVDTADAERRRQRALRALDERLSASKSEPPPRRADESV